MQKEQPHSSESLDQFGKRGRGRPRAFDRGAALGAATRLFWRKGFGATSIADLTEAMGIGSPSLYAAFGSKEALYVEALGYYRDNFDALVWEKFFAAPTAREAVEALLFDSASALTGGVADIPRGCMLTLSTVADEGHADLGCLVKNGRAATFDRLKSKLGRAIQEGEVPTTTDVDGLCRFIQAVQSGMSILARDGASRVDLEAIAQVAMDGWDART
jgi:AcrR family transcriptional regulator